MKKVLILFLFLLMLCLIFVSCNSTDIYTDSNSSNIGDNGTNTGKSPDTLVPNDDKDLDNQDILDTLVPNDEDFPFDNIVVARNGYDVVAAGKYYGNDFDNVKYYGSYYRIIDNYEDFLELTQWGNQLDETIFDENFVLILYSYTKCSVYYSHPNFSILNQRGRFGNFGINLYTKKLELLEKWSLGGGALDLDGYVPPKMEDYTVIFPTEKQETIYLLVSKDEMPNNLPINGEIELNSEIIELG